MTRNVNNSGSPEQLSKLYGALKTYLEIATDTGVVNNTKVGSTIRASGTGLMLFPDMKSIANKLNILIGEMEAGNYLLMKKPLSPEEHKATNTMTKSIQVSSTLTDFYCDIQPPILKKNTISP